MGDVSDPRHRRVQLAMACAVIAEIVTAPLVWVVEGSIEVAALQRRVTALWPWLRGWSP